MMRRPYRSARASSRTVSSLLALAALALAPQQLSGQSPDVQRSILRFETTPIGALPPMALPMPASRDHKAAVKRLLGED